MSKTDKRKVVIINQAVNYLTIGLANEFHKKFDKVVLITGSIHVQGEDLDPDIKVASIHRWKEQHGLKKMLGYFLATFQIYWLLVFRFRKYEVFFISLPPMAYLLNIILRRKFSMLIWDVYPDVFKITGMKPSHIMYRSWATLNKISFNKAYKIFTIGDKIADLIAQYVDRNKIIVAPIWSIFQENKKVAKKDNPFISKFGLKDKFIVQYSGNIGLTHNVEVLVDIAKEMQQNPSILFQIIGRGPRKAILEKRVKEEGIANCQFLAFQTDKMFPFSLSAADLGVVILDELTSKGSVPSKSYNLMSYGIPSLYIASLDSELKSYADKFEHARCFSKVQIEDIINYILTISKDAEQYKQLSLNSLKAAGYFKRGNAAKFVDLYLND